MKPIGRVWRRGNSLSGYVLVGMSCIKFGGSVHEGSNFLFLSKSQRGESEDEEELNPNEVYQEFQKDCNEALALQNGS
jgi:hypothetical protein